jgi:uncharacterized integral membrane protein
MQEQEPKQPPAESRQRITQAEIRWIAGGVVAILFGVFIAGNTREVPIDFVFFTAKFRLIWLFPICAIIGAVIDRLLQRRGLLPTTRKRRSHDDRHKSSGQ